MPTGWRQGDSMREMLVPSWTLVDRGPASARRKRETYQGRNPSSDQRLLRSRSQRLGCHGLRPRPYWTGRHGTRRKDDSPESRPGETGDGEAHLAGTTSAAFLGRRSPRQREGRCQAMANSCGLGGQLYPASRWASAVELVSRSSRRCNHAPTSRTLAWIDRKSVV